MVTGRRLTGPKRCSTAASIKSRTSSPLTPLVVARKLMASRSQQSSAKATRTRSPLSQPIRCSPRTTGHGHELPVRRQPPYHQAAHALAGDAAGSGQEAHGFPITAVERKRNPHPLAVVAADLKAVGAPTPITFMHCNAAVMAPLVPANVAIEQQAVSLHDPVDSLVIGRF